MYAYRLLVYCHLKGWVDITKYIEINGANRNYYLIHLGYNIYVCPNEVGLAKNNTWYYINRFKIIQYDKELEKIFTKLYITKKAGELYASLKPGHIANLL